MFRRGITFALAGAALVFGWALRPGPATAGILPSSEVLVPYFEVDLGGDGRTTLFALVNHAPQHVRVRAEVFTNWGISVLAVEGSLAPDEVATVNLRDWLIHGRLPDRQLTADELAHLQAALAGQRSPQDQLYYANEVVPGRMVGYVTMRQLGPWLDSLWGDYYIVDPGVRFAQGETLANLDRSVDEYLPCIAHGIRFLAVDPSVLDTEFMIWTERRGRPSPEPRFPDARVRAEIEIYDETGRLLDHRVQLLLPVQLIEVCAMCLTEPFGWFQITTDTESFVAAHVSTPDRFSLAVHSYCLTEPPGAFPGPGIHLAKLVNEQEAGSPPGPVVPAGSALSWEYVITNTGDVALSAIAVSDDQGLFPLCPQTALEPGESMTCTATSVAAPCLHANTATATGAPPEGDLVSDQDVAHYTGDPRAAIALEKATNGQDADTPPGPQLAVGGVVVWTYVVTNTGASPLTQVAVTDDRGVGVSCPKTALAPGESMTCTAAGVATAGPYRNVGTARGRTACEAVVTATDPSHYQGRAPSPAGCSPGYWKNHPESWAATGYTPGQATGGVFTLGGYPQLAAASLGEALAFGGGPGQQGAAEILLRAAVAALLNAAHPAVDFPRTAAQVVGQVDAALVGGDRAAMLALAAALDADNNLGCPLD